MKDWKEMRKDLVKGLEDTKNSAELEEMLKTITKATFESALEQLKRI